MLLLSFSCDTTYSLGFRHSVGCWVSIKLMMAEATTIVLRKRKVNMLSQKLGDSLCETRDSALLSLYKSIHCFKEVVSHHCHIPRMWKKAILILTLKSHTSLSK